MMEQCCEIADYTSAITLAMWNLNKSLLFRDTLFDTKCSQIASVAVL
jgi:hypothetical protein